MNIEGEYLLDLLFKKKTTIVIAILIGAAVLYLGYLLTDKAITANEVKKSQEIVEEANIQPEISSILPMKNANYSITYSVDRDTPNNDITIKIFSSSPYFRHQALRYLMNRIPDLNLKYRIEFPRYEYPINIGDGGE